MTWAGFNIHTYIPKRNIYIQCISKGILFCFYNFEIDIFVIYKQITITSNFPQKAKSNFLEEEIAITITQ